MAEHKKGARPNWGQVKVLEARIAYLEKFIRENTDEELRKRLDEQMEGTSVIVRESDAWREKYRKLDNEYKRLKSEVSTLEQSNRSMEGELKRKTTREQSELKRWKEKAIENETEVMRLKARSLWERILNK